MAEISSTDKRAVSRRHERKAEQASEQTGERETLFVDTEGRCRREYYRIRTAFEEFLGIPVAIAGGLFEHLPLDLQRRTEEVVLCILPTFDLFVLTHHLDTVLHALLDRLEGAGREQTENALRLAIQRFGKDIQV